MMLSSTGNCFGDEILLQRLSHIVKNFKGAEAAQTRGYPGRIPRRNYL
jgi:hypothetical protein